jgi:hypothetical protein
MGVIVIIQISLGLFMVSCLVIFFVKMGTTTKKKFDIGSYMGKMLITGAFYPKLCGNWP